MYFASGVTLHAAVSLLGALVYTTMIRGVFDDEDLPPIDLSRRVALYLEGRRT